MGLEHEYGQYLVRFDELVGTVDIGQVGSFKGKLVKKLSGRLQSTSRRLPRGLG